jgi:hypothetical protein
MNYRLALNHQMGWHLSIMLFSKSWFLCVAVLLMGGCSMRQGVVDFGDGRYEGGFDSEGRRNGNGIYHWNNGDRYEGPFLRGKRHGQGGFIWANGDKYTGGYRNGKKHGHGSYNWINGASYNGQYAYGKRHGRGTFVSVEGSRYDGWWRDDMKEGQGILTQPDGRRVEGRWSRGELRPETAKDVDVPVSTPVPTPIPVPVSTPIPVPPSTPAPPEQTIVDWSGTEEQSMTYFEPQARGNVSAIHVKETGKPFEGTITILLDNGQKRGQVPVVNGLLNGEEILWGDDGNVIERNRYENGKLIEEQIFPQPEKN